MTRHLQELIVIDQGMEGMAWEARHFMKDFPEKWVYSRLIVDGMGRSVGFAIASAKPEGLHLHRLAVAEIARGRGLGTLLMSEIGKAGRNHCSNRITLKVSVHNTCAVSFYRNLGLRVVGTSQTNLEMSCLPIDLLNKINQKGLC